MTRAKALLALILAVLWLPVTMHCALEGLPGLEFLICCDHAEDAAPHEDDDCQADACAVVESGLYKSQEHDDLIIGVDDNGLLHPDLFVNLGIGRGILAEPYLTSATIGWHFASRAAGFPRAPSSLL